MGSDMDEINRTPYTRVDYRNGPPGSSLALVTFVTRDHRFSGTISTEGRRLLDLLNDENKVFLSLQRVRVYRRADAETLVEEFPEAIVRKKDVSLAIISDLKHEASRKRWSHHAPKPTFGAFLAVSGYEIRGKLHLNQRPIDLASVLIRDLGAFFPVTQAEIADGNGQFEAAVVIANKSCVSLLYESERPPTLRPQVGREIESDVVPVVSAIRATASVDLQH